MPYYRILVWTKVRKKPYSGIRLIGDPNINSVHQIYQREAFKKYRQNFIDVEIQMLSKLSTAVKEHMKKEVKE